MPFSPAAFLRNNGTRQSNYDADFLFSRLPMFINQCSYSINQMLLIKRWRSIIIRKCLSSGLQRHVVQYKFTDVSRVLAPSIVVLMETASTSETPVNAYQSTRSYNPEDSHLHTRRRENLKSYHRNCLRGTTLNRDP
jgi:hypothetical protein